VYLCVSHINLNILIVFWKLKIEEVEKMKNILEEKREAEDFELLKVIELPWAEEISENASLIGDYIPKDTLCDISPGPEIKVNSLYIAKKNNHLEIGYSNIKIIR
jgi:hypothetical protein